jgi:hypothetical protein
VNKRRRRLGLDSPRDAAAVRLRGQPPPQPREPEAALGELAPTGHNKLKHEPAAELVAGSTPLLGLWIDEGALSFDTAMLSR